MPKWLPYVLAGAFLLVGALLFDVEPALQMFDRLMTAFGGAQ